jgi:hypothetical protein
MVGLALNETALMLVDVTSGATYKFDPSSGVLALVAESTWLGRIDP